MSEFVQNANDGNFTEAVLNTKKPAGGFLDALVRAVPRPGADCRCARRSVRRRRAIHES